MYRYIAFCSGHNNLQIQKIYQQELGHKIMILNVNTNGTAELRVLRQIDLQYCG